MYRETDLEIRLPSIDPICRPRHPSLKLAIERMKSLARKSAQFRVEWDALQYLAEPDRSRGRSIIQRALVLLTKCELPDRNDACRFTGRMMVTGAIVYDWLYDLLTPTEKQQFIAQLVRLAATGPLARATPG